MTRRQLIKALAALPFVGGLMRRRLDVTDVVKGLAPTAVKFNAWDEYVYLKSEGLSEFQALAVLAPCLQNNAADDIATQVLIRQATSYGLL